VHTGQMVERAKARGEVAADVDATVVADLIASFAWTHLLTDRLDEDEAILRRAVRYILKGIVAEDAGDATAVRRRRRRIIGRPTK
ncbi:MAG: hypothetical protein E5W81_25785, partial [Mesorhizobium sp.]